MDVHRVVSSIAIDACYVTLSLTRAVNSTAQQPKSQEESGRFMPLATQLPDAARCPDQPQPAHHRARYPPHSLRSTTRFFSSPISNLTLNMDFLKQAQGFMAQQGGQQAQQQQQQQQGAVDPNAEQGQQGQFQQGQQQVAGQATGQMDALGEFFSLPSALGVLPVSLGVLPVSARRPPTSTSRRNCGTTANSSSNTSSRRQTPPPISRTSLTRRQGC